MEAVWSALDSQHFENKAGLQFLPWRDVVGLEAAKSIGEFKKLERGSKTEDKEKSKALHWTKGSRKIAVCAEQNAFDATQRVVQSVKIVRVERSESVKCFELKEKSKKLCRAVIENL